MQGDIAVPENGDLGNRGWRVTFAGMGINLALGVLYSWSVISKGIPKEWNWSEADKSWPYAIACLVFAIVMVPAGRMQDKIGPRIVATVGGVLVGIGMILASRYTTSMGYIIGFGVLAGAGIGCGYASATPPAVKWFPAAKTGMIAGIVVSGFGLASVYIAPLCNALIGKHGVPRTVLVLGVGFLVVVVILAQFLRPPHRVLQFTKGLGPAMSGMGPPGVLAEDGPPKVRKKEEFTAGEMLGTRQFYLLWFMYACGAGAGLMIISKLAMIATVQAGVKLGFLLVAVLAVGNGGGRILAGTLSDKLGRKTTMFVCFLFQAVLMILLSKAVKGSHLAEPWAMALISALIGANYGANLALFPAISKDFYGLKNFGVNYGLVFTAWGVGGFVLPLLAGKIYDNSHSFNVAYFVAAGLLVLAAITVFAIKTPHHLKNPAPADS